MDSSLSHRRGIRTPSWIISAEPNPFTAQSSEYSKALAVYQRSALISAWFRAKTYFHPKKANAHWSVAALPSYWLTTGKCLGKNGEELPPLKEWVVWGVAEGSPCLPEHNSAFSVLLCQNPGQKATKTPLQQGAFLQPRDKPTQWRVCKRFQMERDTSACLCAGIPEESLWVPYSKGLWPSNEV